MKPSVAQIMLFPGFNTFERKRPVNVASVPHRSPFRYPGGKTWLVPIFRRWMGSYMVQPQKLIEPFAGGGIIGLTAAFEKLADKIVMVELDDQIAAVWATIFDGNREWLAKRILSFDLNLQTVRRELTKQPSSRREFAFQTVLKNRTTHGGILADGAGLLKNGENGKGVASRWYPETIAKRIIDIGSIAERIEFIHGDAFSVLTNHQRADKAVFFIDPPYTAGGKNAGSRLYKHSEIDHELLFSLCKSLSGDFLMTYDNSEEVRELARKNGFETKSVAMKNTHHSEMTELLIGKDLGWMEQKNPLRKSGVARTTRIALKKLRMQSLRAGQSKTIKTTT